MTQNHAWWHHTPALKVDWMDDALCAQVGPDPFFLDTGGSSRQAIRVCRNCTVQRECLTYAMSMPGIDGIFAGTTPRQRSALRKQRRAA